MEFMPFLPTKPTGPVSTNSSKITIEIELKLKTDSKKRIPKTLVTHYCNWILFLCIILYAKIFSVSNCTETFYIPKTFMNIQSLVIRKVKCLIILWTKKGLINETDQIN